MILVAVVAAVGVASFSTWCVFICSVIDCCTAAPHAEQTAPRQHSPDTIFLVCCCDWVVHQFFAQLYRHWQCRSGAAAMLPVDLWCFLFGVVSAPVALFVVLKCWCRLRLYTSYIIVARLARRKRASGCAIGRVRVGSLAHLTSCQLTPAAAPRAEAAAVVAKHGAGVAEEGEQPGVAEKGKRRRRPPSPAGHSPATATPGAINAHRHRCPIAGPRRPRCARSCQSATPTASKGRYRARRLQVGSPEEA
jgi:hypothetical protein